MRKTQLLIALAAIGFTGSALATNGMNLEGYGPVAAAMGGASMAYDNGTAAVMNNPATLGLMAQGSRFDVALGMLGPDVTSKMTGAPNASSSGDKYFMPAVGWVRKSDKITFGVGMFGQGGMGTEYGTSSFVSGYQSFGYAMSGGLGGSAGNTGLEARSELGVGRLIFPLAYQASNDLIVGGSIDFVWAGLDLRMPLGGAQFGDMMPTAYNPAATQTFGTVSGTMVDGLATQMGLGNITDVRYGFFDFSNGSKYTQKTLGTGWAGKLGITYKVSPQLTVGGTYHSKTSLGDLKGDATVTMAVDTPLGSQIMPVTGKIKVVAFEWPETYGLGLAYQANDKLLVAVDYKRINWADVMKNFKMSFTADNSAANTAMGFAGATLDATLYQNWKDQDIIELGASYKATDALTLRAGVNLANNPIPDLTMNYLFPAIEKSHYTLGLGYAFTKASDVNFSMQFAPKVSQTGASGITVDHSQTSWQFMYSYRY